MTDGKTNVENVINKNKNQNKNVWKKEETDLNKESMSACPDDRPPFQSSIHDCITDTPTVSFRTYLTT